MDLQRRWRLRLKRPIMLGTKRCGIDRDEVISTIYFEIAEVHDRIRFPNAERVSWDIIDWDKSDPMTREEFDACDHGKAFGDAYSEALARAEYVCAQIAERGVEATHRGRMDYLHLAYSREGASRND